MEQLLGNWVNGCLSICSPPQKKNGLLYTYCKKTKKDVNKKETIKADYPLGEEHLQTEQRRLITPTVFQI